MPVFARSAAHRRGGWLAALTAGVSLLAFAPAHAQTPALSFSSAPLSTGNYTLGWAFTLANPVTVTALGYFDEGGDGLSQPHAVAIWTDVDFNLQTGITVGSGTGATLIGNYRYVDITPIILPAGNYVVGGATSDQELWAYGAPGETTGLTTDPSVTLTSSRYGNGSALTFPTLSTVYSFYGGGNFLIDGQGTAAPEPGALALAACALTGMGIAGKRRGIR